MYSYSFIELLDMQALTFTQSDARYHSYVQALLNRCSNFYLITWLIQQDTIFDHLHGFIGISPP